MTTTSRILLLVPAALMMGLSTLLESPLILDSEALASGRFWTLWTGHFLHWTPAHFFWDWALFVFCLWMLADLGWRVWGWILATLPILSLAVFLWRPELSEYRGLSGVDTVLFTRLAGGLMLGNHARGKSDRSSAWLGGLALLGLVAKITWEFHTGGTLFSGDLGPGNESLPEIHAVGLLIGLTWTVASAGRIQIANLTRTCSRFPREKRPRGFDARPNSGEPGPRTDRATDLLRRIDRRLFAYPQNKHLFRERPF